MCVVVFKQKTAYEMRISDWSSDVCSSDLLGADVDRGLWSGDSEKAQNPGFIGREVVQDRHERGVQLTRLLRGVPALGDHRIAHRLEILGVDQIGIASCRE